jgi:hypothetical protein
MSVYAQLLEVLSDGDWHDENDLRPITPFTREWISELRHDGAEVAEDSTGAPLVRLRQDLTPA